MNSNKGFILSGLSWTRNNLKKASLVDWIGILGVVPTIIGVIMSLPSLMHTVEELNIKTQKVDESIIQLQRKIDFIREKQSYIEGKVDGIQKK